MAMKTRLLVQALVRVSHQNPSAREETILFSGDADEHSELLLSELVDKAVEALNAYREHASPNGEIEVQLSIQLHSDDPSVRPALHLDSRRLQKIARTGASVDFDPYCYHGS